MEVAKSAKNMLGPLIRTLREKHGWSPAELAERYLESGFDCQAERILRIESQEEVIADYEVLIFETLFPDGDAEFAGFYADEVRKRFSKPRDPA